MTRDEMDAQDKEYQVQRIDALEAQVARLEAAQAALREEMARWLAEATTEMDERVKAVEERAGYLMFHASV